MTARSNRPVALREVVGSNGLFTDGDWVESKDQDPSGDIRLIQLADIGVGEYLDRSKRFLTSAKAKELGCTFLCPGDLLIARMPDPLGRACVFPGDSRPCVTAVDVCILRPDTEVADTRWLMWALNAPPSQAFLARFTSGSTRPRVSRGNLGGLPLHLPPLPQQRRIAALLDKADGVRRKRQQAIRLADDLLRSAFLDMFGDPVTNSRGWPVTTIGDVAPDRGAVVDGPFGSALKPECYVDSGVIVVRNFNVLDDAFDTSAFKYVTQAKFEQLRRSEVAAADVLISTKGTIGSICLMPDLGARAVLSASGTVRVRVPTEAALMPQFMVSQMIDRSYRAYLRSLGAGSNQKYLNLASVRSARLVVPPLDVQERFVTLRHKIRAIGESLCVGKRTADALFASLYRESLHAAR